MNLFANQTYLNLESFCKDSYRWETDFKQINSEQFNGSISLIDIGDIQIGKIKLNGKIEQNGLNPLGFRTIVIPADSFQSFIWLNRSISENDFLIFSKHGDLDAISYNNFHYYMISIKEELLADLVQKYGLAKVDSFLSSEEKVLRLNSGYFTYIQEYLKQQFLLLNRNSELINSSSFLFKLRYKFTYLLFSFLDTHNFKIITAPKRKRDKALNVCLKYIKSNKDSLITLSQLTEISNMSERTLQLAFLEYYGIGPKEYINYIKLNNVREKLIHAKRSKGVISQLALESGFNHLGQFSAAYNKLFNELPKNTLKGKDIILPPSF